MTNKDKYIEVAIIAVFSTIGAATFGSLFLDYSLLAKIFGAGIGAILGLTFKFFLNNRPNKEFKFDIYLAILGIPFAVLGILYALEEYSIGKTSTIGLVFSIPILAIVFYMFGTFVIATFGVSWQGMLGYIIGTSIIWNLKIDITGYDVISSYIFSTLFLGLFLGIFVGFIFQKLTDLYYR